MIEVYQDKKVFSKMMEKIQETKDQYYVDDKGIVLIRSGHSKFIDKDRHFKEHFRQTFAWVPYLELMSVDKKLQDDVITSKLLKFTGKV